MKGFSKVVALAGMVVFALAVACSKPKPVTPSKPVPPGTVEFQFTAKVQGPLDLTIDGVRIPVQQVPGKKCKHLTISGLAMGRHHIVLLSALDAFGPDQVDVELTPAKGEFQVLFSQVFKSVLYGTPEATPKAEGMPGVVARLQP